MTTLPALGVAPAKSRLPLFTALSRMAVAALLLTAAADLVAVVLDIAYHNAIVRLQSGDILSISSALTAEDRQRAIGWTQLALFLATAVFFIAWFHRAYKNVAPNQRFRQGWAIGAWFVPFLNLVRPKAIMNDIWRDSDPNRGEASIVALIDIPWFVTAWWAAFVVASIASRIAFQSTEQASSLSALATATSISAVTDGIDFVAALLAVVVVARVLSRQRARAAVFARGELP